LTTRGDLRAAVINTLLAGGQAKRRKNCRPWNESRGEFVQKKNQVREQGKRREKKAVKKGQRKTRGLSPAQSYIDSSQRRVEGKGKEDREGKRRTKNTKKHVT